MNNTQIALSTTQAANAIGTSVGFINSAIKQGQLKVLNPNKGEHEHTRISMADLKAFDLQHRLDPLLTTNEAAQLLGVCSGTIRRLVKTGALQHHGTGITKRLRQSEVLQHKGILAHDRRSKAHRVPVAVASEKPEPITIKHKNEQQPKTTTMNIELNLNGTVIKINDAGVDTVKDLIASLRLPFSNLVKAEVAEKPIEVPRTLGRPRKVKPTTTDELLPPLRANTVGKDALVFDDEGKIDIRASLKFLEMDDATVLWKRHITAPSAASYLKTVIGTNLKRDPNAFADIGITPQTIGWV